jgi:uncharacterized coiled-coil protein SlyX
MIENENGETTIIDMPDAPTPTVEELQARVFELERYIALQTNTIAAFRHRNIRLEMEIVELMSQLPHIYTAPITDSEDGAQG